MATSKTIKGLTVEIGGDTTKLGKAIKDVEAKSRSLSKELGDINKLLKLDPGNTELLAQKQKVLGDAAEAAAKKLLTLKEAEQQVQQQFERGDVSEEQLRALQREIVATENKMQGYKKAAQQTAEQLERLGDGAGEAGENLGETGDDAKKAAKKVDDFADAADDANEASSGLGSTLATAAKTGLAAIAAAAGAAVTGLVAAAESTREYRTEMGKLNAAYTTAGKSTAVAGEAYKTLYGIIGETDQSVEAAQQIALLAKSEEDVAKWADLAAGVVGRFGDALMPEVFFESANETLKLNEATGSYVQLLEGVGMDVEAFNAGLQACTTEQEKQAYMLAITQQALGSAGDAYRENNAEVIRANEANDAWMQSLAGIGGAMEPIITDIKLMGASLLSEAVPGVEALAGALRGIFNGEEGAAGNLAAAISGMVSGLASKITEALPTFLATGGQIVAQLATGIANNLPAMVQGALNALGGFVNGLQTYLPMVLAKGREILMNLATGIKNNLPSLVSQALDIIMNFAQTIYDNAPSLIKTGFDVLSNLVSGIMSSLPVLISKVPEIISKFANTINDNFPTILKKGAQLILQIIKGILSAIPTLIANIPKIITAIVDVWEAFNWLNLGKKAITMLKDGILKMVGAVKTAGTKIMQGAVNAVKNLPTQLANFGKNAASGLGKALSSGWATVKSGASKIFTGIVSYFKDLPAKLLSVGKDLVKGLWNGISDMTGWIIGKIQGFGESVLGGIKSFFGIKSPSKVMAKEVGRWLPAGMAEGIEANTKTATRSMIDMAQDALAAANSELSGASLAAPVVNGLGLERSLQTRTTATQAAATAAGAGMLAKLDAILAAIERGQVLTIDRKLLVGGTANDYDTTLGQRRALVARGAL